jgi:cytochrome c oxidase cbb3-type subunit 3
VTVRVLLVLVFTAVSLFAQHTYTPEDLQEGQRIFRANCILCHGPDGDQVPGIDLAHAKFRQAYSQEALVKIIQNGKPGTAMPPNNLQDFQAEIVLAYLKSIVNSGPDVAVNGNSARGKIIFEGKGGCAQCHRVGTQGSRVGPDLSDVGALRRASDLQKSLLDPDAEILPQNRTYRVVTKQGRTITGRLLNLDSFSVQILDSSEHLVSLERPDLREAAFIDKSPMPSYRDKLSAAELSDLVAYLASLKGL